MKTEKRLYYFLMMACLFALCSCANRGSISGGDKDGDAPKILSSLPKNESLNFSEQQIVIEFDENVKLVNLNQNLLISPPLDENPKITAIGKKLVIELPEDLTEDITYSINFGDAIQDVNEGNPISGYSYVFATGSEIDTLTFNGYALDAATGEPVEGAWAMLHRNLSDSAVQTEKPYYIARVNKEDGGFAFSNVAEGDYKLYSLLDNNFNYLYDLPNEKIGYLNEIVYVNESPPNGLTINMFEEGPGRIFARELKQLQANKIRLVANGSLDSLDIELVSEGQLSSWSKRYSASKDTLDFLLPRGYAEDRLYIRVMDGKNDYDDTLSVRLDNEKIRIDSTYQLKSNVTGGFQFKNEVTLSHYYDFVDVMDALPLLEDSLSVAGGVSVIHSELGKLILDYPWAYGREYSVDVPEGLLYDYLGNRNDSLVLAFKTPGKEELSTLNVTLLNSNADHGYVMELLNSAGKVQSIHVLNAGATNLQLEDLKPSSYSVKLIIDENNNGIWDSGSYKEKLQPEKIIFYSERIDLLANWDKELELDVSSDSAN